MKLIHSADWQIGARFRQFGSRAEFLRGARMTTLRKALQHAADVRADAFVIAGDLFEDNQVEAATVRAVYDLFAEFSGVRVFIAPGNHDPFTGPASIWGRLPFSTPLSNVEIFREAAAIELDGGFLLGNPLTQKTSTQDPSAPFAKLAAPLDGKIKIGVTHGSLKIDGKHKPDDFPIALDAATRAGLDYLAIGHWHSAQTPLDGGRLVMPGTPEPTDFSERDAGFIFEVEIAAPGAPPRITRVRVAELRWEQWEFDFVDAEAAVVRIKQKAAALRESGGDPSRAVVRVALAGSASPAEVEQTTDWLKATLAGCAVCDVRDATHLDFKKDEFEKLAGEHPILAQTLLDLESAQARITGVAQPGEALSAEDLRAICDEANIECNTLDASFFHMAQRTLMHALREAEHAD
jgi:DNA repair exonuclease SbcCD nuclease subunit